MGIWVKNKLSGGTISRKSSTSGSNVNVRVRINQPRGRANVEKGGYSLSSLKGESISKQLVSSSKKGWGQQACYQSEGIKSFIPYSHFKMEGLHLLEDLLRKNNFMCKVDLNNAYFCVLLHRNHQKFLRFQSKGNIYVYLCLCFGLGPARRIFTKLLTL